jgi:AraC family transcriptional regulator of arabinose operon
MPKRVKEHLVPGMAEIFASLDHYQTPASARGALQPWVLGLTLRGAVLHDAEHNPTISRVGDCVLIRALTPQYWRVPAISEGGKGHWRVVYCAFTPRPHWYVWLQAMAPQPVSRFRPSTLRLRRAVRRRLIHAHRLLKSTRANRHEYAMLTLERVLLDCWSDHLRRESHGLDPRIKQAIDILTTHAREPLRLDQLARRCHLSRSQFSHLFRTQVGLTPFVFQERRRIETAQRMLRMSMDPVRNIALACGFEDPRYFATRFKHETKLTPREYRKSAKAVGEGIQSRQVT